MDFTRRLFVMRAAALTSPIFGVMPVMTHSSWVVEDGQRGVKKA